MIDAAAHERKLYSQFTQDGITEELVRLIDPPKYFVEIGAGHNGENNTHILLDHGWEGLMIEGKPDHFSQLRVAMIGKPKVVTQFGFVTVENVNTYFDNFPEAGFLSIDVDGNDYWLWKALKARPTIVVIEANTQKPEDEEFVAPYDPGFVWDHKTYENGASVASLKRLGTELGYQFVGRCSNPHAADLFFVRNDVADMVK